LLVGKDPPRPALLPICQKTVASGQWARKFIQDRLQVLIPEYLTCKSCQINILRGSAQDFENMGLASRIKYNGINILQARY
jgi:hypothetical protein